MADGAKIRYSFTMVDHKRTDSPDWEDLRHFTALARHGSLSATARALGVNHATVSRRIAALEAELGTPLFERRSGGWRLTDQGRAILEDAQAMEAAALAVRRRAGHGEGLTGPVRLATTRVLADGFLAERLGAFHRLHPGIDIDLIADSRRVSLARGEAEIALRFGTLKDSTLLVRTLTSVSYGFHAAPAWRTRLEAGEEPVLIGFDADSAFVPEADWLARSFPAARVAFRSNSWAAQAAAARAGLGIALLPRYLAAGREGLEPVSLGRQPPTGALAMLLRPDLIRLPRVRALADFLAALFREQKALFCSGD